MDELTYDQVQLDPDSKRVLNNWLNLMVAHHPSNGIPNTYRRTRFFPNGFTMEGAWEKDQLQENTTGDVLLISLKITIHSPNEIKIRTFMATSHIKL